jgi:CubicO group peptidase (beta-lactamase class C family)
LDQPVAKFVPEFAGPRYIGPIEDPITKEPGPPPAAWRNHTKPIDAGSVTFRQLLTHTSGLPAWRNLAAVAGGAPERPGSLHRSELMRRQRAGLAAITTGIFAFPPGAAYLDSDLGFILLGAALARCAADPTVAETIRNWVTDPLWQGAHFNPSSVIVDQVAPTEFCAWRKRRLHGEVHDENAAGLGGIAGHAGLFGTAADIARLGNLYLAGGEGLLKRATVEASIAVQVEAAEAGAPILEPVPAGGVLTMPQGIRRGLGWQLRSDPAPSCSAAFGPRSYGHTGYTGGSLWCDPDRDLVVVLLTNRVYHGRNQDAINQLRPAVHVEVVAALSRR